MQYNEAAKAYEGAVLLKQGYYSYRYVVVNADGTTKPVTTEGSFYQTRNKYQVLVYYKGVGDRTDRLLGYGEVMVKVES